MSCPAHLPGDVGRTCDYPVMSLAREILHPSGGSEGLHVVGQDEAVGWRWWYEGGDLLSGQGPGEDADLVDVSDEIRCDSTDLDPRRRSNRGDGTCRVLGHEHAVHVEFRQAGSEHAGCVMPRPVVVCERAQGRGVDIRLDGLVEGDLEPSVVPYL